MRSNPEGTRRRATTAARARWAALAALALFGAGCSSSEPLFTVEAAAFAPTLSGDVGLTTSIGSGVETIDIERDLGLGGSEVVPYLRGEVLAGGFDFEVSGFRTEQSGQGTMTADFGGITAGTDVNTRYDLGIVHGHLAWDFVETKWLDVGAGIGGDYVGLSFDAEATTFATSESVDVNQVVPLVVARAAFRLPVVPIDLELGVGAITGSFEKIDGTVVDAEAILRGRIVGPLSIFAGYRFVHFDIKGERDSRAFDGDVVLSGFMAGASIRF
jgi:hypothetical protein